MFSFLLVHVEVQVEAVECLWGVVRAVAALLLCVVLAFLILAGAVAWAELGFDQELWRALAVPWAWVSASVRIWVTSVRVA